MFTGIVEELGRVRASRRTRAARASRSTRTRVLDDAEIGASIAVNGCCLTVVELRRRLVGGRRGHRDARPHRPRRPRAPATRVNLERPVRLADRLGGHLVQGHVDGDRHRARPRRRSPTARRASTFAAPADVLRYVVEKGSITVDGISLTVAALDDDDGVRRRASIPHTLAVTTLGTKRAGDPVNLEVDVVAKYVERLLQPTQSRGALT